MVDAGRKYQEGPKRVEITVVLSPALGEDLGDPTLAFPTHPAGGAWPRPHWCQGGNPSPRENRGPAGDL